MGSYDESSIQVLSGLEAVRRRPGMYIGDTQDGSGMHHLLWEVMANAVNEHVDGSASYARVTMHDDGAISVEDDGRGIPTDPMPHEPNRSALQVVLSRLHAGGCGKRIRGRAMSHLWGVGLAAVNALSASLDVEVWRGGRHYIQSCAAGVLLGPMRDLGPTDRTGTRVTLAPDFTIFARRPWDRPAITRRLREVAALFTRLTVMLGDRAFRCPAGLDDHVRFLGRDRRSLHGDPIRIAGTRDDIGVDVALLWTDGGRARLRGFVNHAPAPQGKHLGGLGDGILRAFVALDPARFRTVHRAAFREVIHPGLAGAVHVTLEHPQLGYPMRELENPEVRGAVAAVVAEQLGARLAGDPALRAALLARMPR